MRVRSIATLCLFDIAAVVALKYPLIGLGICDPTARRGPAHRQPGALDEGEGLPIC